MVSLAARVRQGKVIRRQLRQEWRLPTRLLGIGLPLTMAIGGVAGWLLKRRRQLGVGVNNVNPGQNIDGRVADVGVCSSHPIIPA